MLSVKDKSRLAAAPAGVKIEDRPWSDPGRPFEALRAQDLLDLAPFLHDLDFVQVRLELPSGSFHREASISPKSSRLAAMFTLGHTTGSFLTPLRMCGCNGTTGHLMHRFGTWRIYQR